MIVKKKGNRESKTRGERLQISGKIQLAILNPIGCNWTLIEKL